MEKGNEEISKKAVSKNYGSVAYEEIRIEVFLGSLVKHISPGKYVNIDDYRLNNIIIAGYKDIGIDGQAVFILRKIKGGQH